MPDRLESPTAPSAPTAASGRRALMADFVAAGELERRRVAEAIHDDSIQVIAAMGMRLQMLRRSLSDAAQLSMLDEAEKTVQLSIRRLRVLVFELQPPGSTARACRSRSRSRSRRPTGTTRRFTSSTISS